MDKDRTEAKAKEAAGWAKEKTGDLTGNRELESEGNAQRAEGKAQGALGKAKEAVGDAADALKDRVKR